MKHLRALNKYFWKYRVRFIVGTLFVIISNYFNVLQPQIIAYILKFVQKLQPGYIPTQSPTYDIAVRKFIGLIEGKNFTNGSIVIISGLIILLLALLRGFFMFLMRQTIIVMSRHIEFDQKNEVYEHYQKLDASFYKIHSTGDLMSRMAEDVGRVRMFTGPAVMYLINLITLITMSVYFMVRTQAELTAYVLAPLPILACIIYVVNTTIHKKSEALQASLGNLTTNAQQSYSGIRVIKSFVQESSMLKHFEENSEKYKQQAVGLAKVESLYFPSMTLLIGLSTLITIMIGGIYYIHGHRDIGIHTIIEFVIYINMLTFPVSAIGWTASMIQRASASQKRLNEFLETKPIVKEDQQAIMPDLKGEISLKNVNFTYQHTGIHALVDINLEIKAGERIAIIGRTGSGKTSLAQVIMRMFDVQSGTMEADGIDIRKFNLRQYRKQISYVPQDGFLFSDTIANNISFSDTRKDLEKVSEAARLSAVENDIKGFPLQYDTEVGERGVTLSGGQKQRISIARALFKEAPILILDDCLSAVDARTEREIISNLNAYLKNRTSILITHRIFNLFEFDKIVVLESGEIKEMGTHEDLYKAGGLYYEMYLRQLQEDQNNGNPVNLAV